MNEMLFPELYPQYKVFDSCESTFSKKYSAQDHEMKNLRYSIRKKINIEIK